MPRREKFGRKPGYIQKRRNAEEIARERQKHHEIISAINSVINQLASNQNQQNTEDSKRAMREKRTIRLLFLAFAAAAIGDVIFFLTMRHADTNFIAQQRPIIWLDQDWIEQNPSAWAPVLDSDGRVFWTIRVKNVGKGTALNVTEFTYIKVGGNWERSIATLLGPAFSAAVPPDAHLGVPIASTAKIAPQDFVSLKQVDRALGVKYVATYTDAAGNPYGTGLCLYLETNGMRLADCPNETYVR